MSRAPKPSTQLSGEQKILIVLSVLSGELTETEAARRHGLTQTTVSKWKRMFVEGGRQAVLEERPLGMKTAEPIAERRLRVENEQLKLALAEAMVQLRIWQRGAEHIREVPS